MVACGLNLCVSFSFENKHDLMRSIPIVFISDFWVCQEHHGVNVMFDQFNKRKRKQQRKEMILTAISVQKFPHLGCERI